MKIKDILSTPYQILLNWPKRKVLKALEILREKYKALEEKNKELNEENAKLKEQLIKEKVKQTNKKVNQPSSKQPEWEEKPGVGNDGKGKRKGRGKKGRQGAGNQRKSLTPDCEKVAYVEQCDLCGKDLKDKKPLKSKNERIIEDIPEPTYKPQVILIKQEKKYCDDCNKCHNINMLFMGSLMFTLYQDGRLFESILRIKSVHIRALKACNQGFNDSKRCL